MKNLSNVQELEKELIALWGPGGKWFLNATRINNSVLSVGH